MTLCNYTHFPLFERWILFRTRIIEVTLFLTLTVKFRHIYSRNISRSSRKEQERICRFRGNSPHPVNPPQTWSGFAYSSVCTPPLFLSPSLSLSVHESSSYSQYCDSTNWNDSPVAKCNSYGVVLGTGAGLVRETAGLVLGHYFRKRREFVEMVVQAGAGVGIVLFSVFYREAVG